jgi:hypothetical protein
MGGMEMLKLVVVVEVVILLVTLRSHLHGSSHLSFSLSLSPRFCFLFLSLQTAATTGGLSRPAKTHQTQEKYFKSKKEKKMRASAASFSFSVALFFLFVSSVRSASNILVKWLHEEAVRVLNPINQSISSCLIINKNKMERIQIPQLKQIFFLNY